MGLRARRPGATTGTATQGTETPVQPTLEVVNNEAAPQQQEQVQQEQAAPQAPATRNASAPAVKGNVIADMNAGILDNIEDLTGGGNFVSVDGTNFLYKDTNEEASEIELVVSSGKRFYQWVDESDPDNKQYHNSDSKLDNRYKLKFELKWLEEVDGEATEYTLSLSTTSAIQFINYVTDLAKKHGKGVGQVVTKMTISRQQSRDGKNRYSRVEFEYVGDAV